LSVNLHASCIAFAGRAALLLGQPGAGKSDLALRAIAAGAVLVADDQVLLANEAGRLIARPPPPIAGLIEVRGIGLMRCPYLQRAPVCLAVALLPAQRVPRLPEPATIEYVAVHIPHVELAAFEDSAVAKLRLAVGAAARHIMRAS
jgi:HPr kinase/phosphorylase